MLAHIDIAEKLDEISAAQALLAELGVTPRSMRYTVKKYLQSRLKPIALIVQVKDNQPTL